MKFDVNLTIDIDSEKEDRDQEWNLRMFLCLIACPDIYEQILKTSKIREIKVNSVEERKEKNKDNCS